MMFARFRSLHLLSAVLPLLVAGCDEADSIGGIDTDPAPSLTCSIPEDQIFDGGPGKDGIPALTDPLLVAASDPAAEYIRDHDRVIGLVRGDEVIAIPHNI